MLPRRDQQQEQTLTAAALWRHSFDQPVKHVEMYLEEVK